MITLKGTSKVEKVYKYEYSSFYKGSGNPLWKRQHLQDL